MAQNKAKIGQEVTPKADKKMSLMARKMGHVKNIENLRKVKTHEHFNK